MKTKVCTKCGVEKEATAENFNRDNKKISGIHPICKVCTKAYNELWKKNNPGRVLALCNRWVKNNPEKRRANYMLWLKNNPDIHRVNNKRWLKKNVKNITDFYVKEQLKKAFGKDVIITQESIELKRAQIKMLRALKQLKKEIKDGTN